MSKHELDCPLSTIDSDVDAKDCVFCPIARAAYQRGREDAAKAVETALNDYMYGEEYGPPELRLIADVDWRNVGRSKHWGVQRVAAFQTSRTTRPQTKQSERHWAMSDYTPTTDEVRDFLRQQAAVGFIADERVEQFDRWLAAHDAEVYQRGREDAAKAVEDAVERYGWLEDVESVLVVFGFRAISAARGDGEQA